MFINFYIPRPTRCFIFVYTCGLKVVVKRICYVMLCICSLHLILPTCKWFAPFAADVNFASLNVFGNSIEKIDFSSFLVCNISLV